MSFSLRPEAVLASAARLRRLGSSATDAGAYAQAHLDLPGAAGGAAFGTVVGSLHGFCTTVVETLDHLQAALDGSGAALEASVHTYLSADELTRRRLLTLTAGGAR